MPPTAYGGTETVVDNLARELAARGHDVVLFTTGDATCPVPRRSVFEHPPTDMNFSMPECRHVQAAYAELVGCEIIHDHTTLGPIWAAAVGTAVPVVVTVHNRFDAISRPVYRQVARSAAVVAISHSHRATAPEVDVAAVIHHGVDAARYPFGSGAGGYVLFVGRMSADKGVADAIRIARAAGIPLKIAAKMRTAEERAYYESHVQPELGPTVTYLGEVSPAQRDQLLADARALVNPIQWPEPFGMVMLEAMACGTPVVAYGNGAAPEIVRDGRTGFICADEASAARALAIVGGIDRAACRAEVEGYFSAERMAAEHEALYERVLAGPGRKHGPMGSA
ncbi:MAG: glycosyltransferase family 4 protein [Candidatus Nanopelagicales bacterium]